jgi:hypothetical protein
MRLLRREGARKEGEEERVRRGAAWRGRGRYNVELVVAFTGHEPTQRDQYH